MTITKRISQVLANSPDVCDQDNFIKLSNFYSDMQQAGIAKKQVYSLPPLDTAGRRLHQIVSNKSKK